MEIPKVSGPVGRSLRISLLVAKAYHNEAFRKRLSTNFDAAANQFNLTAQEKKGLRDVDWSGIVDFVNKLGTKPQRLGALKVQAVDFGNAGAIKRLGSRVVGLSPAV